MSTEARTRVLAIDPGTTESAYVLFDGQHVLDKAIVPNELMEGLIPNFACDVVACEMIASYGMAVGRETFETVYWIGRFAAKSAKPFHRLFRLDVKLHLCKSTRAKDGNVRQALIDRFGGDSVAVGKKAKPGPLYGVSSHLWSALAIAVTWHDQACASANPV